MNEYEMVVAVVTILAIAAVVIAMINRFRGDSTGDADDKLAAEVKALSERLSVLERITVEKENSLAREIESLREATPV